MVRLKAFVESRDELIELVSIPYGTIKRMLKKFEHQQAYDVSIPYGTIKSLKKITSDPREESVSIPYGTIKSLKSTVFLSFFTRFNSLWYD